MDADIFDVKDVSMCRVKHPETGDGPEFGVVTIEVTSGEGLRLKTERIRLFVDADFDIEKIGIVEA